jgi:hypothetical protein
MKDIHECIGNIGLAKSTIFTTFDLTSGFWKMPLHASSVPKTAFTLPGLGQYKWLMSPTGLISCPASFQWLMEKHNGQNQKHHFIHQQFTRPKT